MYQKILRSREQDKQRIQNTGERDAPREILALRRIKNVVQYYITFRDLFLVQANWVKEDLTEHPLAAAVSNSRNEAAGTQELICSPNCMYDEDGKPTTR